MLRCRNVSRAWAHAAIFCLAAFGGFPRLSVADTCIWSDEETGVSADGRFSVLLKRQSVRAPSSWRFTWTDTDSGQSRTGPIKELDSHAHLVVLVSHDGSRFAIADLFAGHRYEDRILIYESTGKLVHRLGIRDILLFHERDQISHSMDHTSWTGYDPKTKKTIWISENGANINLMTKSETPAAISWQSGKVTRQPWTLALIRWVPWAWFTFGFALLIARILLVKPESSQLQLSLDLSMLVTAVLGSLVLLTWKWHFSVYWTIDLFELLSAGLFAVGSFLLIWIVLGRCDWRSSWTADLLLVGVGVTTLGFAMALTYGRDAHRLLWTSWGLVTALLTMLTVIAWNGYRLRKVSPTDFVADDKPTAFFRQFQIRDLFFSISFLAFFMTTIRLRQANQLVGHWEFQQFVHAHDLYQTLNGVVLAFFAVAVAWTILTAKPNRVVLCIVIMLALSAAITAFPNAFRWRGVDIDWWQTYCYSSLILVVFLLVTRWHGYRIRDLASA